MLIKATIAAQFLGVSARRVRALLAQKRIFGFKDDRSIWMVDWPLQVLPGKRGPDLKHFPVRRVYGAHTPSKPVREGTGLPSPKKKASKLSLVLSKKE